MKKQSRPKKDTVEISLVIDDNSTALLHINLAESNKEHIIKLCNEVSDKYHIDSKVKKKLFLHLTKELALVKKENEEESAFDKKIEETFHRLYYIGTEKRKERERRLEKKKKERIENEMMLYSFTPNARSSSKNKQLDKIFKPFQKIEEKLYNDYRNGIERKNFRRLVQDIQTRVWEIDRRDSFERSESKGKKGNTISETKHLKKEGKSEEVDNLLLTPLALDLAKERKIQLQNFNNNNSNNKISQISFHISPSKEENQQKLKLKKNNTISHTENIPAGIPISSSLDSSPNSNMIPSPLYKKSGGNNAIDIHRTFSFSNKYPGTETYLEQYEKKIIHRRAFSSFRIPSPKNEIARGSISANKDIPLLRRNTISNGQARGSCHLYLNTHQTQILVNDPDKMEVVFEKENELDKLTERKEKEKETLEVIQPKMDNESKEIKLRRCQSLNVMKNNRNNEIIIQSQEIRELSREKTQTVHKSQHQNIKKNYREKKEQMRERYYEENYPFRPCISPNSKVINSKKKHETSQEFLIRISKANRCRNKSITEFHINIRKTLFKPKVAQNKSTEDQNLNLQTKTQISHSTYNPLNSYSKLHQNYQVLLTSADARKGDYCISTTSLSTDQEKKRNKEIQNEKNIHKKIQKIKESQIHSNRVFQKIFYDKIEKFKLNNLKNIYEILTFENNINFERLDQFGVPNHIKDKLVIPTCRIMAQKKLEFNFKNFSWIASELLNKFFSVE